MRALAKEWVLLVLISLVLGAVAGFAEGLVRLLIGHSSVFVSSSFLLFAALVLNDWLRERLNPKCPRCGAMNGEEARFCSQCGAPLSEDSDLPRLVVREEH